MDNNLILIIIFFSSMALAGGYIIAHLRFQKQKMNLGQEITRLSVQLENETNQHENTKKNQTLQQQLLSDHFQLISNKVLKNNTDAFLQLAKENLGKFQMQAKSEMDKKEESFKTLVKPIADTLEKTQTQIHLMEKDRKESYGALDNHLRNMAETQKQLQTETRNLVQAFRRPEVRGQWGELTLKRLAELAGMAEHCDFVEQPSVLDDEGLTQRPDMIVKLPVGREIIVDSKTPLDAYLDAIEANSEEDKKIALERHLRHVKKRVKELASKAYWEQFTQSPDFVVLFIPGDQFLNAALDMDRNLIEDALKNKVILSTPTSFVALLRAVAYGWRQESLAENAEKIRQLGEEMYNRISVVSENLAKVGKSLDQGVVNYNKTVASLSGRVLPTAKKFKEMGVPTKKDLPELNPLEKSVRELEIENID